MYSLIHILYAIRQFGYGNFDMDEIKKGFNQTFGLDFDGFMSLDYPNDLSENFVMPDPMNPARVIMYNDILLGVFDANISANPEIPYDIFAEKIEKA